jgi:hypothetical protein
LNGDPGRTGGIIAIVLSSLWALAGVGVFVFGAVLYSEASRAGGSLAGLGQLLGIAAAVVAVLTISGAALGVLLGKRLMQGRARITPAVIFGVIGTVFGMYLVGTVVHIVGLNVLVFGLHTAACISVPVFTYRAVRGR